MLVLTRTQDAAISIGDQIIVKVVAVDGGQVRIGIEAPRDVVVLRAELLEPEVDE